MKIDCTKAVNFLNEWRRMCDYYYGKSVTCEKCILFSQLSISKELSCYDYVMRHGEDAIALIQKWSDEHIDPNRQKTYADDFLEKFPNAMKTNAGVPRTCWAYVYGKKINVACGSKSCEECWIRPMEDKPND